jgi:hypothetical protein
MALPMLPHLPWCRRLLWALFAISLIAGARGDNEGEEVGAEELDDTLRKPPKPFDPREAFAKLAAYQASNPEFAAAIATYIIAGVITFTLGTVLFLYSEIKAMLVVRV